MYIGRLFFRKDTGNLVYWYEMQGDIIVPTVDQDLSILQPLKDYSKESILVVEIDKEDIETRENCRTASGIRLNLETNELIFDFTPERTEEMERQKTLEERISELEQLVADLASLQLGV